MEKPSMEIMHQLAHHIVWAWDKDPARVLRFFRDYKIRFGEESLADLLKIVFDVGGAPLRREIFKWVITIYELDGDFE